VTLACGKRIPDSEHAVSLSLPTLRDVIGYEEKSADVFAHICSGYPRFVKHWTVERVQALLRERYAVDGLVVTLHDQTAAERLMRFVGRSLEVLGGLPFGAVVLPSSDPDLVLSAQRFLQHTGCMLSSRQAEDFLGQQGVISNLQDEPLFEGQDPARVIRTVLAGLYGVALPQVRLYPSGMNAYFAVFDEINRFQQAAGRRVWLQVGWLYLDTTAILDRFSAGHVHVPVSGVDALDAYLVVHRGQVAGITTEVMTNPLLETPDLVRLRAVAHRHGLPLIVDISMPTPVNVDVLPYADVVIESLTKFASGHADVMGGAVVFNTQTEWGSRLSEAVCGGRPYERDLRRLALHIQGYPERMARINANTAALVDYFRSATGVRQVHWAGQPGSSSAYEAVRRPAGGYGGVVSVVFDKPLEQVYDGLALCKGPSFGTEFTLCMAYVYMAHYDLVTTASGRARLQAEGIDPGLLRISVGLEPVDELIQAFEKAQCTPPPLTDDGEGLDYNDLQHLLLYNPC